MCFYYSINKSNADTLVKKGVISKNELEKVQNKTLVNGFERPSLPVVSNINRGAIDFYQWGLVPSTVYSTIEANSFVQSYNTLNAKIEGAKKSKIYNEPISSKRCLVLTSGFFEWKHVKGKRIPYYISLQDESLFAFAGIWDRWIDEKGESNYTFSILTTSANELMSQIHNTKKRMPVILEPDKAELWLSQKLVEKDLKHFHEPIESKRLKAYTIKQFLPIKQSTDTINDILDYFPYPEIEVKDKNRNDIQLSLDW